MPITNEIKLYKSISSIPTPYSPNSLYAVRVGLGIDIYIANSTGDAVFKHNTENSNLVIPNSIEDAFVRNNGSIMRAVSGTSTLSAIGTVSAYIGTATGKSMTTNKGEYGFTNMTEWLNTAGTAGWRFTSNNFYRSNKSHRGGLNHIYTFGIASGATSSTRKFYAGYDTSLGWPTPANSILSILNSINVHCEVGDTNFQVGFNGASGTMTKVDTGIAFPISDRSKVYEITIVSKRTDTNVIVSIKEIGVPISSTTSFTYTITDQTKLPNIETLVCPKIWITNTTTTLPNGIGISNMYM